MRDWQAVVLVSGGFERVMGREGRVAERARIRVDDDLTRGQFCGEQGW